MLGKAGTGPSDRTGPNKSKAGHAVCGLAVKPTASAYFK